MKLLQYLRPLRTGPRWIQPRQTKSPTCIPIQLWFLPVSLQSQTAMEEFLSGHFIDTDVLHIFVSTAGDGTGLGSAIAHQLQLVSGAEKTLPVRKSQSCKSCSQHMVIRGSVQTFEDLRKAAQKGEIVRYCYRKKPWNQIISKTAKSRRQPWVDK